MSIFWKKLIIVLAAGVFLSYPHVHSHFDAEASQVNTSTPRAIPLGSSALQLPLVGAPPGDWNTFMGSSSLDRGFAVAADPQGNVYVTGNSAATWGTPIRPFSGSSWEVFVAKLDRNGNRVWSTFLGSISEDRGRGIAVDNNGNVYVTGFSGATWGSPVNPFAGTYMEIFVAKLNTNGILQWNTFMGSQYNDDYGHAIAVDAWGNSYVTGYSGQSWGSPVNPFAGTGFRDAFAAKLNSGGTRLWHTFMGGSSSHEYGEGISVDMSGNVYVGGYGYGTWGSPVNAHAGQADAFAVKLNSSGARLWHTFMGSATTDYGYGVAADPAGNVFVAGSSDITWGSPIRPHAGGYPDAFGAKLNSSGSRLWHTFLGSIWEEIGYDAAADILGNFYVGGISSGSWGMPIDPYAGGVRDAFAAKLNTHGKLQWNSYKGAVNHDYGHGVAVDPVGSVYLAGYSLATWGTPVNPFSGGEEVFAAKIASPTAHYNHYVLAGHDFNGDGSADIAVWKPSNGRWFIKGQPWPFWGGEQDICVQGDYNGDGITDIAVWRPSNGRWYIKGQTWAFWGAQSDIPVPADYNGDNITDVAVWRPGNGRWYIKGQTWPFWGGQGDLPVPGDYDGDNLDELAVWKPGNGTWYIQGKPPMTLGQYGDIPVPADYDADGIEEAAVWRPSDGKWYIDGLATQAWGQFGDIPCPGDYDGNGTADIAVWRPGNGRWYIKNQSWPFWGGLGDFPLIR